MSDHVSRFLAKTTRAPSGCLIWLGYVQRNGYGQFSYPTRKSPAGAHRVSHMLFIGPIPDGYEVDHLCRVRRCVEPTHLEAVPRWLNLARSWSRATLNARKTRCPQRHPYSPENTYVDKNGRRYCRTCQNARRSRYNKPLTAAQRARKSELQRQRRADLRAVLDRSAS